MSNSLSKRSYRLPVRRTAASSAVLSVSMFQLSHLLHAGVGISIALQEMMVIEASYTLQRVWRDLARYVDEGYSLSDAMKRWPCVFDKTLVAVVLAGEKQGDLAQACHQAMRLLQWQAQLRARFTTALVYPLFSVFFMVLVVVFLMVSVVPAMDTFLGNSVGEVQWHTRSLLGVSAWMREYGVFFIGALVLLLPGTYTVCQMNDSLCQIADRLLLRMPLAGRVIRDMSLSQYGHTCARLYGGGVPLTEAMHISEGVVSNRAISRVLAGVRERILAGSTLRSALGSAESVPIVFRRLLSAGESAGALREALLQAARQQQQQTDYTLDRAEKLIGPLVLLGVGGVISWMVISLLSPVYQHAIEAVLQS